MKISLKIKVFLHGIVIVLLFLLKITLQNTTVMDVQNVFLVIRRRQQNTFLPMLVR